MAGKPPFRSITSLLIRRTVQLALLCMVIVMGVQAWLLQREQRAHMARVLQEVADYSVPQLTAALWDIEPSVVEAQVKLIAQRPEIGYARLQSSNGQRFGAGLAELASRSPDFRMPLRGPRSSLQLGELELVNNPEYYWQAIWQATWEVLLGYGGFTLALCLMMVLLLRGVLQRPLQEMASFASELTPQRLMTPLRLGRSAQSHVDEIDLLAEGFSKLQAGLRDHISNLDGLVMERTAKLEQLLGEIRELSVTDALTGAYNRRTIEERLPAELERTNRFGHPLSLIFVDLDHFKQINDTYGHAAGDDVLGQVVEFIRGNLRQSVDWIARYGGEEFLVVLPETDNVAATVMASRLCLCLQALKIECGDGTVLDVTASFGVATNRPGEHSATLLARADALVYRAKSEGRNRVVAEI